MSSIAINLLGPLQVSSDGEPITRFESVKVRALLAYLASEAGKPQARSSLAGLLWPDWPEDAAQKNLRHTLYSLRKTLGDPGWIEADRQSITLLHGDDCQVDALELEQALREFRGRRSADERLPAAVSGLRSAVELYRGAFLEGFTLDDSQDYEAWIVSRREYHAQQALEALGLLAGWHEEQGEHEQAEGYARRQLAIEPWWEAAHRQIMRSLARRGERSQAIAQYEACKKALRQGLEMEPGEETTRLYLQIREGRFTLAVPETTIPEQAGLRHNLPRQLTSLIGREKETKELQTRLAETPLVTVTGPGGIGKTRLALQIAEKMLDQFKDGAWWVDLAPITDPELVAPTAARAVGMVVDNSSKTLGILLEYLKPRQLLLVLDNCEHLIETCAPLAEEILKACPNVTILATSRETLGLFGESLYPLGSLSTPSLEHLPELEELTRYESVRLFAARAVAVRPGFALNLQNMQSVAQICAQLDGIPLAIELTAARTSVLTVEQIARRLKENLDFLRGSSRSVLPRHQTLQSCLAWSYDLLSDEEQGLFQALAVFAGGWTLEAAETVCTEADGTGIDTLDLLSELVNKSLVVVEAGEQEARYRFLEPVRQYAQEKLSQSGRMEETKDRHLAYYQDLARRAKPHLRARQQLVWMMRLETELQNIRQVLDWAHSEEGPLERLYHGLDLAADLRWFWHCRLRWEEGYYRLERLLEMEKARRGYQSLSEAMCLSRAYALEAIANLAPYVVPDYLEKPYIEESQALFQSLGEKGKHGLALTRFYDTLFKEKDFVEKTKAYNELFNEFEMLGDHHNAIGCIHMKGADALYFSELDQAEEFMDRALNMFRELGDRDAQPAILAKAAMLAYRRGDQAKTQAYIDETRKIIAESGEILFTMQTYGYEYLGDLSWKMGNLEQAERDYRQALRLDEKRFGFVLSYLDKLGRLALVQGKTSEAGSILSPYLETARQQNKPYHIFQASRYLADLAWVTGSDALAISKFEELAKIPVEVPKIIAQVGLVKIALAKEDWAAAGEHLAQALELQVPIVDLSISFEDAYMSVSLVGVLALALGHKEEAARVLGAADNSYRFNRLTLPIPHREMVDAAYTEVREWLSDPAFAATWQEGVKMNLSQSLVSAKNICLSKT